MEPTQIPDASTIASGASPNSYGCKHCGDVFGRPAHLDFHIRLLHRSPKAHQCTSCLQCFDSSTELSKHEQLGHPYLDGPKHNCPDCDKSFARRPALAAHRLNAHPLKANEHFRIGPLSEQAIHRVRDEDSITLAWSELFGQSQPYACSADVDSHQKLELAAPQDDQGPRDLRQWSRGALRQGGERKSKEAVELRDRFLEASFANDKGTDVSSEAAVESTFLNLKFLVYVELDPLAANFATELATRIVHRAANALAKGGTQSQSQSLGWSASTSSTSSTTGGSVGNQPRSRKRSRGNRDDDGNGDDEDRGNSRPRPGAPGDIRTTYIFACPYHKFDAHRYSERNQTEFGYRKCSSHKLVSISALKQHLGRIHKRPDFYCGRCYREFRDRNEFHEHQNEEPPCRRAAQGEARFTERMSDDQWNTIKSQRLGNSRASWFKIFEILFPGVQLPASPYVTGCDAATVQHFAQFFVSFGAEEMLGLLHDRLERNEPGLSFTATLRTIIAEAFEIALPGFEERVPTRPSTIPEPVTTRTSDFSDTTLGFPPSFHTGGNLEGAGTFGDMPFETGEIDLAFEEFGQHIFSADPADSATYPWTSPQVPRESR